MGISLRQAAIIAGLGYLLSPVSYAEFTLYPKLVIAGHIEQTAANVAAHPGTFATMMLFYFVTALEDILIAWALYVLLASVNRALSLLMAWFQLVYAGIYIVGIFNLFTVYRLFTTPSYESTFGHAQLLAQADLLIHTFRYTWQTSLIIFGIHLCLLGYLMFRLKYVVKVIPMILGVLLAIDGLAWIVTELQPYLYPSVNVDGLFPAFFGELIFMLWLLIGGWWLPHRASGGETTEHFVDR